MSRTCSSLDPRCGARIALRIAIGAGRARLLQLVTESCVLTLLGAAAGLVLGQATIGLLMTRSP